MKLLGIALEMSLAKEYVIRLTGMVPRWLGEVGSSRPRGVSFSRRIGARNGAFEKRARLLRALFPQISLAEGAIHAVGFRRCIYLYAICGCRMLAFYFGANLVGRPTLLIPCPPFPRQPSSPFLHTPSESAAGSRGQAQTPPWERGGGRHARGHARFRKPRLPSHWQRTARALPRPGL